MLSKFYYVTIKEKDLYEGLAIDMRTVLEYVLKKYDRLN